MKIKYFFTLLSVIITIVNCDSYGDYLQCLGNTGSIANQCQYNYYLNRNEQCQKFVNNCSNYDISNVKGCNESDYLSALENVLKVFFDYYSLHCTKSKTDNKYCYEKYNNKPIDSICKTQDNCKESIIDYTDSAILLISVTSSNSFNFNNINMLGNINKVLKSNECKNGSIMDSDNFVLKYDDLDFGDGNSFENDENDKNDKNDKNDENKTTKNDKEIPKWKEILIYAGIIIGTVAIIVAIITLGCICYLKQKRKIKNENSDGMSNNEYIVPHNDTFQNNQTPPINTTVPNTVPQVIMFQPVTPTTENYNPLTELPSYDQAVSNEFNISNPETPPQTASTIRSSSSTAVRTSLSTTIRTSPSTTSGPSPSKYALSLEKVPLVDVNQTETPMENGHSVRSRTRRSTNPERKYDLDVIPINTYTQDFYNNKKNPAIDAYPAGVRIPERNNYNYNNSRMNPRLRY